MKVDCVVHLLKRVCVCNLRGVVLEFIHFGFILKHETLYFYALNISKFNF